MRPIRSLLSCALVLLAASAQAQVVTSPEPPPTIAPATPAAIPPAIPPVPLLWKISDADNKVYVLGSFHLLKPDDYPLSPDVEAAFADAEQVVFELPPEEMASPTLGLQMGQAALRTDGTTLDSQLTAGVAAKLKAWMAANQEALQPTGITMQSVQQFEPWFVGLMVSITEMSKLGLDPKLGLDAHFAAEAKNANKPTAGLETGAQQIAFLDGMDRDEQVQMLAEALEESEEGRAEVERLHSEWREGDAQGMWDGLAAEMKAKYPKLFQRINVERNDAWVPKIEQSLKSDKDDTLLVVGTLHTLGPDGIVEKLKARGYTVERICSACTPMVEQ